MNIFCLLMGMVNTFITSTNLKECAKNLDNLRLNKQILEGTQIIKILDAYDQGKVSSSGRGFVNHPATKMWLGHTNQLKIYVNHMIREWVDIRGKNHSIKQFNIDESKYKVVPCRFDGKNAVFENEFDEFCFPKWFFHLSYFPTKHRCIVKNQIIIIFYWMIMSSITSLMDIYGLPNILISIIYKIGKLIT